MQPANRFEDIGGGVFVEVSREHGFGEDALLLAQFAAPRPYEYACDLGTGCGIIPLWWCRRQPAPFVQAIELQPTAAMMAKRSVERANLQHLITVYQADLKDWRTLLKPGSQHLVTMNPPYFAAGSGALSRSKAARISRHEGEGCTLAEVTQAAYGLLRQGGRFCICHKPERLCDVLSILRASRIEPKCLRFVYNNDNSQAWLFLCEAHKGGSKGLKVMPPFICYDAHGNPTKEYLNLFNI